MVYSNDFAKTFEISGRKMIIKIYSSESRSFLNSELSSTIKPTKIVGFKICSVFI